MGYEISGALGVKMAIGNDRDVYAMVGDGSFLMLHSELITAIQEGIKINVCLFDNSSFGCINNLQVGQGNATMATELRFRAEGDPHNAKPQGKFMALDFAKVAEGYGCKAYKITNLQELEDAIKDAKQQTCSTLFDIKVMPKSMTDGYESWWRVGVAEVSEKDSVRKMRKVLEEHLETARRY